MVNSRDPEIEFVFMVSGLSVLPEEIGKVQKVEGRFPSWKRFGFPAL